MNENPMQICLKNGIIVYPVRQKENRITEKKNLQKNHWYIEVDNNGRKTIYDKSLGSGSILCGDQFEDEVHKTYIHWAQKLKNK